MKNKIYLSLLLIGLFLLPFSVKAEDLAKAEIDYIGENKILYTASNSDIIPLTLHTTDKIEEGNYNVLYKIGEETTYTTSECYVSYSNVYKYYKCGFDVNKSKITDSEFTVSAKLQKNGKDITNEAITTFLVYKEQTLTDNGVTIKVGNFPYNAKMTVDTSVVDSIKKQSNTSNILYYTIRIYGSDGKTLAKELIDKYKLTGAFIEDVEIDLPSSYTKTKKTYPFLFDNNSKFVSNATDKYALTTNSENKTKINFSTNIYGRKDYNNYDYMTDGYIVIAEASAFNVAIDDSNNSKNKVTKTSSNQEKNPNTSDNNLLLLVTIGTLSVIILFICSKKIRKVR